jgi:septal ring factor EnvC (AmiA/AmiB activator)
MNTDPYVPHELKAARDRIADLDAELAASASKIKVLKDQLASAQREKDQLQQQLTATKKVCATKSLQTDAVEETPKSILKATADQVMQTDPPCLIPHHDVSIQAAMESIRPSTVEACTIMMEVSRHVASCQTEIENTHAPSTSQVQVPRTEVHVLVQTDPAPSVHVVAPAPSQEMANLKQQIDQLRYENTTLHRKAMENYALYEQANRVAAESIERHDRVRRELRTALTDKQALEAAIQLLNAEVMELRNTSSSNLASAQIAEEYYKLRDEYYSKVTVLEQEVRILKAQAGDDFESVMVQELRTMRAAYEKRLAELKEDMRKMSMAHAQTATAMQETFRAERRALESRLRQMQSKIELLESNPK